MQKITPCLWFDNNAEEAVKLYTTVFKDSKIGNVSRYGKNSPGPEGQAMTIAFTLNGYDFLALNGGPMFRFTEAVSFTINCKTQEEVDHYWNGLTANGGSESMCGWLKDKFGLSWQVTPEVLPRLLQDKDPKKSQSVMQAMLKMKKIDIKAIQDAYDNA